MKIPSIEEMLQAGVHFGHQISRWHPKMKPYIFTHRNGVHVIDLEQTAQMLPKVLEEVKKMAADGKKILFFTTKAQGKEIVKQAALDAQMPYLTERWMGGILTNFPEMKKLIKKYVNLREQQKSGEFEKYTKKEQSVMSKELEKMAVYLDGLVGLEKMPDVIFLPSFQREKIAVTEANKMHVPVIGVCDTNANPLKATHVIPANDDGVRSIEMIVGLVAQAIKEGNKEREKNAKTLGKDK